MIFPNLSDSSKVWVYKANRELTVNDQEVISEVMNEFVPQWAAHGDQLLGAWTVLDNWFLVLAVDESRFTASGCSIDSSVRVIKSLGDQIKADFFNRMKVLIEENGEKKEIHFSELDQHPDALLYNPMITDLKTLRTQRTLSVKDFSFA